MRFIMLMAVSATALAAPAQAASSTASTRISGIIPAFCTIDVLGGNIDDHRLTINVRRTCNTSHLLVFSEASDERMGDFTLRYNNRLIGSATDYNIVAEPEGYYDQVDTIEIRADDASAEDFQRYAAGFNVAVEVS